MDSIILVSILLYLLSSVCYLAYLYRQKDYLQRNGLFLLLIGFLFHTLTIIFGFIKSGHLPVSNMHETLSFAGWAIAGVFFGIQLKFNLQSKGFEFCPEVVAKWAKMKCRIVEVPISYKARTVIEGKKIKWQDGIIALFTLIKYRFIKWKTHRKKYKKK